MSVVGPVTEWPRALARLAHQLRTGFGGAFVGTELPDSSANPAGMKAQGKAPHSVFTNDLIDAPGQPTRDAVDDVIAFFRKTLKEECPAA
jgi:hypothetical protein